MAKLDITICIPQVHYLFRNFEKKREHKLILKKRSFEDLCTIKLDLALKLQVLDVKLMHRECKHIKWSSDALVMS